MNGIKARRLDSHASQGYRFANVRLAYISFGYVIRKSGFPKSGKKQGYVYLG